MDVTLRVGASAGVITPRSPVALAGYARRTESQRGTLDDLMCRAIVFDDGDRRLVLAVCDLLYATHALTSAVRRKVEDRAGIPPEHVMVTATHTHSGPGRLAVADGPVVEELSETIATTIVRAAEHLAPARLLLGTTGLDGIARNRRDPDGPRLRDAQVLLAVPRGDASIPIATLVAYACHPTILEHDNVAWSGDFPGAACRRIERTLGGVALYLQGCAGDINPVFVDHAPRERLRVGWIVASAAIRAACELMALPRGLRTINLSWDEEVEVESPIRGRAVEPTSLAALTLPVVVAARRPRSPETIAAEAAELRRRLAGIEDRAERHRLLPRVNELWVEGLLAAGDDLTDSMDVPPAGADVEIAVQGFRLGEGLTLIGLPGEPFVETGLVIQAGARGDVLVSGYANGAVGYLPTAAAFDARGYEVGCTLYARGTAEALETTAGRIIDELAEQGAADRDTETPFVRPRDGGR